MRDNAALTWLNYLRDTCHCRIEGTPCWKCDQTRVAAMAYAAITKAWGARP